jgi:hypothetical protein
MNNKAKMLLKRARAVRRAEKRFGEGSVERAAELRMLSARLEPIAYSDILNAVSADGRDVPEQVTDTEKQRFICKVFVSDYWNGHRNHFRGVIHEGAKSWLQGLPRACIVTFENFEIMNLIARSTDEAAKDGMFSYEDELVEAYWNALGMALVRMCWTQNIARY